MPVVWRGRRGENTVARKPSLIVMAAGASGVWRRKRSGETRRNRFWSTKVRGKREGPRPGREDQDYPRPDEPSIHPGSFSLGHENHGLPFPRVSKPSITAFAIAKTNIVIIMEKVDYMSRLGSIGSYSRVVPAPSSPSFRAEREARKEESAGRVVPWERRPHGNGDHR
jgi:hypothetical protein